MTDSRDVGLSPPALIDSLRNTIRTTAGTTTTIASVVVNLPLRCRKDGAGTSPNVHTTRCH